MARWLAIVLIKNNSALYSQHIRGKHNFIADSLSRDHHLSDEQLTHSFKSLLPSQTPENFKISPIPTEVDCWISSFSRKLTATQDSHPPRTKSNLIDGADSWEVLVSKMNSCQNILANSVHTCCPLSQALAEEICMVRKENRTYGEIQSNPPYRMYERPSGKIYGRTRIRRGWKFFFIFDTTTEWIRGR